MLGHISALLIRDQRNAVLITLRMRRRRLVMLAFVLDQRIEVLIHLEFKTMMRRRRRQLIFYPWKQRQNCWVC
jgi:hypothetical protein